MHFRDIEKLWAELPNTLCMKWETLDVLVTPDNHFNEARFSNVLFMYLVKALFEYLVEIFEFEWNYLNFILIRYIFIH